MPLGMPEAAALATSTTSTASSSSSSNSSSCTTSSGHNSNRNNKNNNNNNNNDNNNSSNSNSGSSTENSPQPPQDSNSPVAAAASALPGPQEGAGEPGSSNSTAPVAGSPSATTPSAGAPSAGDTSGGAPSAGDTSGGTPPARDTSGDTPSAGDVSGGVPSAGETSEDTPSAGAPPASDISGGASSADAPSVDVPSADAPSGSAPSADASPAGAPSADAPAAATVAAASQSVAASAGNGSARGTASARGSGGAGGAGRAGCDEDKGCYVVQAGDTMNAIAAKFDLTPSELARLNRIPTNSMLFPGRKLSIPAKRRRPAPPPPPPRDRTTSSGSSVGASPIHGVAPSDGCGGGAAAELHGDPAETSLLSSSSSSEASAAAAAAATTTMGACEESASMLTELASGGSQASAHRAANDNDIFSSLMMPPRLDSTGRLSMGTSSAAGSGGSSAHSGGGGGGYCASGMPSRARPSHVLKINARHITDGQGVVTGTLLITPNNIMFSPNVSDLIVIEHGTEHYEVTAPVDMIAGAALYTDIAIMRTKHHQKPVVCNIPVHVYYSETEHENKLPTPPSSPNRLGAECGQRPNKDSESGSEPVSPRPTKTPPSSPIVGGGRRTAGDRNEPSREMEEPEVFAALEKLLPKPAQSQDNGMLYLCLRMGKPINKIVKVSAVAVGRRKLKCEYWFGIPRNRVDEVYKFFQRNYPEKYGDVIELDMKERGFEDIDSDEECDAGPGGFGRQKGQGGDQEGDDGGKTPETPREKSSTDGALTGVLNRVGSFKNPFKLPRFFEGPNTPHPSFSSCEWEVIALKDEQASNQAASGTCSNLLNPLTPDEILLPEMVDESEILDEEHRRTLYKEIPARAEGYAWRLVYSTTRHGFSLKTFYREMARHDGPVLLAITDTDGALFGAFVSQSIHPSDHFYGTGEMFLWSFYPEFTKYAWSGDNQYFTKGNQDSLVFGSGDGEFGLYIDGDLYYGRSAPCKTFRNEVLSKKNDFVIKSLEAWGFF